MPWLLWVILTPMILLMFAAFGMAVFYMYLAARDELAPRRRKRRRY